MDWGGTQNRCQIGKVLEHLLHICDPRSPSQSQRSTSVGQHWDWKLAVLIPKCQASTQSFPGQVPHSCLSLCHRLSSPKKGQPGSYSFTWHQQSQVLALTGARRHRGSEHRRCVGRKTPPLTQSLRIHLFLLQDILLKPGGQHQRGSLASLHILSRPQEGLTHQNAPCFGLISGWHGAVFYQKV